MSLFRRLTESYRLFIADVRQIECANGQITCYELRVEKGSNQLFLITRNAKPVTRNMMPAIPVIDDDSGRA